MEVEHPQTITQGYTWIDFRFDEAKRYSTYIDLLESGKVARKKDTWGNGGEYAVQGDY
jgi:hypothetical protein